MELRERLKEETRHQHELTEEQMGFLLSPMLSKEMYIQVLRGLYCYHAHFEERLSKFSSSLAAQFYQEPRPKTKRLVQDLGALGASADAGPRNLEALTKLDLELQGSDAVARLWGHLYVIEGSTLGGQIIQRKLKDSLNLTPETGASYYSGYGPETGPMWRQFLAALNNSEAQAKPDQVLEGAKSAFQLLGTVGGAALKMELGASKSFLL